MIARLGIRDAAICRYMAKGLSNPVIIYHTAPVWAGGLNKMKKIYKKEEGVSPVIATILMVAITVVLAATVYIMVSGMGTGGTNKMIANLTYKTDTSNINAGYVNMTVSMSQPSGANPSKVIITVDGVKLTYVAPGNTLSSGDWSYMDLDGSGTLSDGDVLIVDDTNIKDGSIIAMSISGYSGNAQLTVP